MPNLSHIFIYASLFLSLYFEIFLLLTYVEKRGEMREEDALIARGVKRYPTVSVIVPCWNEETTVSKTVHSLLNLDYPKDKLKILIVNDGSTDNTWNVVQKFKNNPQVELYTKENGGKYTALNLGLSKINSELVGCLDADSYVHKDALKHIVVYFQDKETMAVAPSVKLWQPKGVLQLLQKVEYGFGIFTRKMFHFMNAVYITPGPFSIFRAEVFQKVGGYRHAHNTEDIEICLRMQKHHFKIAHAHSAEVYTVAPNTIKTLLKQRVRWSNGFVKNALDYRDMFFKKEYGNVSMIILPMASISFLSVISMAGISVFHSLQSLFNYYVRIQTVGWSFSWSAFHLDWFSVNTQLVAVVSLMAFIGTVTLVLTSRKMSEGKLTLGMDLIYFLGLYMFIAPIWMAKALYNSIFSIKASWR